MKYLNNSSKVYYPMYLSQEISNYRMAIKSGLVDQQIQDKYNWSNDKLNKIKGLLNTSYVELDAPRREGTHGFEVEDTSNPAMILEEENLQERVVAGIKGLAERERKIVLMKFYPGDEKELSYKSIGNRLGLSKPLVSNLSREAIKKLKLECC
jgi:RNA polymerase sigma factor (sigma-70 family)